MNTTMQSILKSYARGVIVAVIPLITIHETDMWAYAVAVIAGVVAPALRAEYQVEYNKTLTQVAGGFKLSCDCCIECNEPVQLREATQFY